MGFSHPDTRACRYTLVRAGTQEREYGSEWDFVETEEPGNLTKMWRDAEGGGLFFFFLTVIK